MTFRRGSARRPRPLAALDVRSSDPRRQRRQRDFIRADFPFAPIAAASPRCAGPFVAGRLARAARGRRRPLTANQREPAAWRQLPPRRRQGPCWLPSPRAIQPAHAVFVHVQRREAITDDATHAGVRPTPVPLGQFFGRRWFGRPFRPLDRRPLRVQQDRHHREFEKRIPRGGLPYGRGVLRPWLIRHRQPLAVRRSWPWPRVYDARCDSDAWRATGKKCRFAGRCVAPVRLLHVR